MKEFFRTSKVTGSSTRSPAIGSLLHANDDVEVLVDLRAGAGRHDCRRVDLLDDYGALKTKAAGQVVALVNGSVEPSALEPNSAYADRLGSYSGRLVHGEFGLGDDADRLQVEAEEADRRTVAAEIVFALVLGIEALDEVGDRADGARRVDGERTPLTAIHHVDRTLENDVPLRDAFVGKPAECFPFQRGELRLDGGGIGLLGADHAALGKVVLHVDQQAAERRGDTWIGRHDHDRDREFTRDVDPMEGARAAKRDEREVTRIVAAADRDQANRIRHVRVGDLEDGVRGLVQAKAERFCDALLDRLAGEYRVEHHLAAGEARAETTQRDVGVRIGRLRIAVAIASRARIGAGRLRAVAERAGGIGPGKRSSARADGEHLDGRETDRITEFDVPVLGDARLALI